MEHKFYEGYVSIRRLYKEKSLYKILIQYLDYKGICKNLLLIPMDLQHFLNIFFEDFKNEGKKFLN